MKENPRRARKRLLVSGIAVLLLCLALPRSAQSGHGTEDDVETIDVERVNLLLEAGEELFIVDLGPVETFQKRRLPGAHSIPLKELPKRFREIPKTGQVILYCDCPQNQLIEEAYQLLKDDYSYRNVSLMIDGLAEWDRKKYSVESGAD